MRLLERILVFVSLLSPVATLAQETASDLPRTLPDDINEVPIPRDTDRDFFTRLGNVREQFVDSGYAVSGALVWDVSPNLRGGIDTQRAVSRYLLGIGFAADLEKVLGWRGATVFVDFQHHDGTLGEAIVGDFQVFSNIDAPRRTQIPRAWLETHWLSDRLRIKAGKIDANNEFAYTLSGGSFLNSSMGFSPTIFVMPTYPDPAGGMVAEWTWSPRWQLRGGVFDGVGVTGVLTGERFPTTLYSTDRGATKPTEHSAGSELAVGITTANSTALMARCNPGRLAGS
jgi:carbohydrate-selective porin OprB